MLSRVLRASAIVTVLSVTGMGAGFLLQVFLAARFGAGRATDAYLAATTVPTLVNTVFLTAMNIAFIPVFIEHEAKSSARDAWRIANSFIVIVLVLLGILTLLASALSGSLIRLLAPGLVQEPTTLLLAADLQRILLPAMIFMAWSGLLAGLFYARESFVIPTLGPLISNGLALALAWILSHSINIHGVAVAVLLGNVAQLLFLLYYLRRRFNVRLEFDFSHPGVKQIAALMAPWILGAMIYKANPIVDRLIASYFSPGTITVLGYAYMLSQIAVFACSKGASLAFFPTMTHLINSGRRAELHKVVDTGLKLVLTVVVPVAVLILFSGEAIVGLVFQRGAFTGEDVSRTALALIGYSGAILALSIGNILTYVFYALQDTKTPALIGVAGMILNLTLALALRDIFGFLAPAVSYSVMSLFNLALMLTFLRRRLGHVVRPGFIAFGVRLLLAGLAMALVVMLARQSEIWLPAVSRWHPLWQLAYHGAAGLSVYLLWWVLSNRALVRQALHQFGSNPV